MIKPGKTYRGGMLRTVDLLVPTSSARMGILLTFNTKTSYHNEKVNGSEPSQIAFPDKALALSFVKKDQGLENSPGIFLVAQLLTWIQSKVVLMRLGFYLS